ncbi:MAG: hypothetical protein J1E38_09550, partial [Paramuribaculum sp.]|nr:hypothetical protein [Paramuribaculum sp.]
MRKGGKRWWGSPANGSGRGCRGMMRSGEGRPWDVARLRRADGWGGHVRRRMLPAVNQSNDG